MRSDSRKYKVLYSPFASTYRTITWVTTVCCSAWQWKKDAGGEWSTKWQARCKLIVACSAWPLHQRIRDFMTMRYINPRFIIIIITMSLVLVQLACCRQDVPAQHTRHSATRQLERLSSSAFGEVGAEEVQRSALSRKHQVKPACLSVQPV